MEKRDIGCQANEYDVDQQSIRYAVVIGGIASGIGKGVLISSTGYLLKSTGCHVTTIKCDPYLVKPDFGFIIHSSKNLDAGLLSPKEHGECYVLDDGGEVDLDLGNYERFLDVSLTSDHNITSGKIYKKVLDDERDGRFLGKTVQVIPHVTNEIQNWIERTAQAFFDKLPTQDDGKSRVCLVEIGGTAGDMESSHFLEAIRQMIIRLGPSRICVMFLGYVPFLGELKTKPTQQGLKQLLLAGITPDIIVCRSQKSMKPEHLQKIAMFGNVKPSNVINIIDVDHVFEVIQILDNQRLVYFMQKKLSMPLKDVELREVDKVMDLIKGWKNKPYTVSIAVIGKYTALDAYLSMVLALEYASIETGIKVNHDILNSVEFDSPEKYLSFNPKKNADPNNSGKKTDPRIEAVKKYDAFVIAGGFGMSGVEGKIFVINYARKHKKPLLGICYGMQLSVIEATRNVLGWEKATSAEVIWERENMEDFHKLLLSEQKKTEPVIISDPATEEIPVIIPMENKELATFGDSLRRGAKETAILTEDSLIFKLYGKHFYEERYRHRFEIDPRLSESLRRSGLRITGIDTDQELRIQVIEMDRSVHPYFIGVQSHPEFKNRLGKPSPLYLALLLAAGGKLDERFQNNNGFLFPQKNDAIYSEEDRKRHAAITEHFESYVEKMDKLNSIKEIVRPKFVEEEEKVSAKDADNQNDPSENSKEQEHKARDDLIAENQIGDSLIALELIQQASSDQNINTAKSQRINLKTVLAEFEHMIKNKDEITEDEIQLMLNKLKS